MMKWMKQLKGVLILGLLISFLPGIEAAASTNNFTVSAVLPDNQMDMEQSYFDLRLQPEERQTVQLLIRNPGNEELTVFTELVTAGTGRNGLIIYEPAETYDETLIYPITDIAAVRQPEMIIPAGESAFVDLDIEMPKESVNGVILGGLTVSAETQTTDKKREEGIGLTNEFIYVVGLKISESNDEVDPDFDLVSILPGLVNYHTAVTFQLQNKAPRIIKNMAVNAQVYQKGSAGILKQLELERAEMAPNSIGDFVIDWEDSELKPGTYRLKVQAEYEEEIWEWDQEFEILSNNAKELNNEAVNIVKDYTWLWIVLAILLILVLVSGAYYLGKRKNNQ